MKKQKIITMYTTTWCADCKRSKKWFGDHTIAYKEINIEEDEAAMAYVQDVNKGAHSVPTIIFPDGSILVERTNSELEEKLSLLSSRTTQ